MIVALLLAVDFMNFTYATNPCASNVPVPVVMRKGSFSYFDPKMGSGFDLHVADVKRGVLQDGRTYATVVVACDFPVGGTAAAYLYAERNGTASFVAKVGNADWGPDWAAGPDSIHITFAKKFLYVDQCKDNECAFDVVETYAMRNGKLTTVYVETHKRS